MANTFGNVSILLILDPSSGAIQNSSCTCTVQTADGFSKIVTMPIIPDSNLQTAVAAVFAAASAENGA